MLRAVFLLLSQPKPVWQGLQPLWFCEDQIKVKWEQSFVSLFARGGTTASGVAVQGSTASVKQ